MKVSSLALNTHTHTQHRETHTVNGFINSWFVKSFGMGRQCPAHNGSSVLRLRVTTQSSVPIDMTGSQWRLLRRGRLIMESMEWYQTFHWHHLRHYYDPSSQQPPLLGAVGYVASGPLKWKNSTEHKVHKTEFAYSLTASSLSSPVSSVLPFFLPLHLLARLAYFLSLSLVFDLSQYSIQRGFIGMGTTFALPKQVKST